MALDFNQYAEKGNLFLKDLSTQLGYPEDTARGGRVLRAVLHVLRDILTLEESMQMMAQLPMFLKAAYVEGWKPGKKKQRIKHVEDFTARIKEYDSRTAGFDFKDDDEIENAASVVFLVLKDYISLGEMEDIQAVMPKELKYLTRNAIML